jgi:hypothetical protein
MIPLLVFYYLSAAIALANDKRRANRSKNALESEDLAANYKPEDIS